MTDQATLPGLVGTLPVEAATLTDDPRQRFARFYSDQLRPTTGARLASSALHRLYMSWARERNLASLSYHQLRNCMCALGHRRVKSNGIQYEDVAWAASWPETLDVLPTLQAADFRMVRRGYRKSSKAPDRAIAAIDGALAKLLDARRIIEGLDRHGPAHVIAARLLAEHGEG